MNVLGPVEYEQHRDFIMAAMAGVEFFNGFPADQLEKACYFIHLVEFEPGEVVFHKDTPGDAFYLVYAGRVEAIEAGLFWNKTIGEVGPGGFFGEMALILNKPRTASIKCLEATQCFRIDRAVYDGLMEKNPELAVQVKDIATRRYFNHH